MGLALVKENPTNPLDFSDVGQNNQVCLSHLLTIWDKHSRLFCPRRDGRVGMLISSKGRYALRLMIYIAALGDAEGKIALREVADRERISQKYLEQLVRPLMKAGLLKSVRGKGGGYMMAKDPAEVRAGDILRAVEGSTAPVACDGIDNSCTRSDLCSTVKFWRGLDDVIEKYVDGVTLADLAAVPEINFDIKL